MSFGRPRRLGTAIGRVRSEAAPRTLLAAVQSAWPGIAGEAIASEAEPVSERDGVVTIACRSATWAQELDLLQEDLRDRLAAALEGPHAADLTALRFTADAARHGS